jgi:hypothetical protein
MIAAGPVPRRSDSHKAPPARYGLTFLRMPFVDDQSCLRIEPTPETQGFVEYQHFGAAISGKNDHVRLHRSKTPNRGRLCLRSPTARIHRDLQK